MTLAMAKCRSSMSDKFLFLILLLLSVVPGCASREVQEMARAEDATIIAPTAKRVR